MSLWASPARSGIQIFQHSKGDLLVPRSWVVGLLSHLAKSVHDVRSGHVRDPHKPSSQLSVQPTGFLFELFPGSEIGRCGRGGVGLSRDIGTFHHLLDTRLFVGQQ